MSTTPTASDGDRRPRTMLQSVEVMRGLAAVAVAIYHTHLVIARPDMGATQVFGTVAQFGWSGVALFFVLSGFIIMHAHSRDIGVPRRVGAYLWRRFRRIYPIYWVFLTAYLAAALFGIGSPDFSWDPRNLLASYLLIEIGEAPLLPLKVAWTLFYEVSFYAAFALLIVDVRLGSTAIVTWAAAIIVNTFVLGHVDNGWYLHCWNFYFVAGALAYWGFRRLDGRWGLALLLTGIAMLIAFFGSGLGDGHIALFQRQPGALLLLAVPFSLIVLGGTLSERVRGWMAPAVFMRLGAASYSIYLTHSSAISLLVPQLHKRAGAMPIAVQFVLVVVIAVVGGVIAHEVVEKRLLNWLKRLPMRNSIGTAEAAA